MQFTLPKAMRDPNQDIKIQIETVEPILIMDKQKDQKRNSVSVDSEAGY